MVSIAYRTVPDFPTIDDVGIRWLITGTDGEIEITSPQVQWQEGSPDITLRARLGKGSQVETVVLEGVQEVKEVSERGFPGGNTARVWQAWLEGKGERFADFEGSLETHRLLDRILGGGNGSG
jgi:hypothetical protein